jgi:endonuclease III
MKSRRINNFEQNVFKVAGKLKRKYGDFAHHNKKNPLDELLFIICSVKTDFEGYTESYRALKKAFPTFDALAAASPKQIAKPLVRGGLYNGKSKGIKKIMDRIVSEFGRPTLTPLKEMSMKESERFLTSLPWGGKKVARCVMMYSLGWEVFPVDTHCWRICRRLGWVRATNKDKICTNKDMDRLQGKVPPGLRFSLHVNFISLGRDICTHSRPKCAICPAEQLCPKKGVPREH